MDLILDTPTDASSAPSTSSTTLAGENPAIEVNTSLPGARVVRVLDWLRETRGLPEEIMMDNGLEFIGRALDEWVWRHKVSLHFIDPGEPTQNAYIQSFKGQVSRRVPQCKLLHPPSRRQWKD